MKNVFTLTFLFISFSILSFGQVPTLLKDINPGTSNSIPDFEKSIIEWNGKLLFVANDGVNGNELWTTDGSEVGTFLLKDIYPGATGSNCKNFFASSSFVFFTATDDVNGTELWRTDGTADGTQLIKNIRAGTANGIEEPFGTLAFSYFVWNDMLYFGANDGTNGNELWKSDGTDAGTVMVKNINTASANGFPNYFEAYNGKLYFQARSSAGDELWVTDGTGTGTMLVKDIQPGSFSSGASHLTACNGYLLFIADDGVTRQELWRSDGTAAGTVLVKDINTTAAQFESGLATGSNSKEKRFVCINNVAYFSANDGTGKELWRSDGTSAGTFMVKDASTNSDGYAPQDFVVVNDILYYKYNDSVNGHELWRSDGTAAGTFMVKDIKPGSDGSFVLPTTIAVYDNTIWCGAIGSGFSNVELWKSDGTEAGTVLVAEIEPGSTGSRPFRITGVNDYLIFGASTSTSGTEFWKLSLLPPPPPLTISATVVNNVLCNGAATGAIAVTVGGGVPPYVYTWNQGIAQGANPTNLQAGDYEVVVTDANGVSITASATITQPTALTATTSTVAATYSNANGSATVTVAGGTPLYSYVWNTNPPVNSAAASNIVAGNYTVTVTDANGCTITATATVDMDTSTGELFERSLTISPSLATDWFSIKSDGAVTFKNVCLMDAQGKTLNIWENVENGQLLTVHQVPDGLYYIRISNGESFATKRLIVVH